MVKIRINYARCVEDASKICVEICPVSIFRIKKLAKSEKPEIVNVENCIMCRSCQANCPLQAIEILT
jgi:NAD-dependent dihydropyrimidine dehydrogenase PreA subunit